MNENSPSEVSTLRDGSKIVQRRGNVVRAKVLRAALLLVILGGLIVAGRATGLTDHLGGEQLREQVQAAGWWGVLIFLAAFSIGQLMHVPGLVFVGVAIFIYGRLAGGILALGGAVLAVTVSFVVVRLIGGRLLGDIDRPLMKRLLAQIDQRPIRAIILLRLVFLMAPPLNYALAMTNVRFGSYVAGSALGLTPPLIVAALLFDWIFQIP